MKVCDGRMEYYPKRDEILKMEEIARAKNIRDYFLLGILGYRGLRISEALQLSRERMRDHAFLVRLKGGEMRMRAIPNEIYPELVEYLARNPRVNCVFEITRRTGYNVVQKYARLAGIKDWDRIHPHCLRHSFGTWYARKSGRDPFKLKSMMGWSDLRMAKTYVEDLSPEEELEELSP